MDSRHDSDGAFYFGDDSLITVVAVPLSTVGSVMMPFVLESQLKGNKGSYLAAMILSGRCLVRPVAAGTDVGIDLFCETITETGKPFQHFWVQVKSGKQIRVKNENGREVVRYNFDEPHLEYWGQQPVPVFAFLIPEETLQSGGKIFIINLSQCILERKLLPFESFERALRVGNSNELESDLSWFINEHVPHQTTGLWCGRYGFFIPIEKPEGPGYIQNFAGIGYERESARHSLAIMRSTAIFGSAILMRSDLIQSSKGNEECWKKLYEIFQGLQDLKDGYENHLVEGLWHLANGNREKAFEKREEAIRAIQQDAGLDETGRTHCLNSVESLFPSQFLTKVSY